MQILRRLVVGLAAIGVLAVGVAYLLPRHVHVERETTIAAPRSTVYALVSGFRTFSRWSPWLDRDPAATYGVEGPAEGAGARVRWESRVPDVASGSAEIVEAVPNERVRLRLDFAQQGPAESELHLESVAGGTRVTWGFDADLGPNPLTRYWGPRFDSSLGPALERALARLKEQAEQLPGADFGDLEVELVDVPSMIAAWSPVPAGTEGAPTSDAVAEACDGIRKVLASRRLAEVGSPIRVTTRDDASGVGYEIGIPIDREPDKPLPARSAVQIRRIDGRRALRAVHRGPYAELDATRDKLVAYATVHGYRIDGDAWDQLTSVSGAAGEDPIEAYTFVPVRSGS